MMLPQKHGWKTKAAFVCYKQPTIAEKVLQHGKVLRGLRDPVVIERATCEAAKHDERDDSTTWLTVAVPCQPHVSSPYTICVANLPGNASILDMYNLVSPFGAIHRKGVQIMKAADGSSCRGSGIVEFMDKSAAEQAIAKLNGMRLPDGHILKVAKKAERCGTSEVHIIADNIV